MLRLLAYFISFLNLSNIYCLRMMLLHLYPSSLMTNYFVGYSFGQFVCGYALDRYNAFKVLTVFSILAIIAGMDLYHFHAYPTFSFMLIGLASSTGFNFLSYVAGYYDSATYLKKVSRIFFAGLLVNSLTVPCLSRLKGTANELYIYAFHFIAFTLISIVASWGARSHIKKYSYEISLLSIGKQMCTPRFSMLSIAGMLVGLSVFGYGSITMPQYIGETLGDDVRTRYINTIQPCNVISYILSSSTVFSFDKKFNFIFFNILNILAGIFTLCCFTNIIDIKPIISSSSIILQPWINIIAYGWITNSIIGLYFSNYIIAYGSRYPIYTTYMSAILNMFTMISAKLIDYIDISSLNKLILTIGTTTIAFLIILLIKCQRKIFQYRSR